MRRKPREGTGKGWGVTWLRDRIGHQGDECLIWPLAKNWNGYGFVTVNRRILYAHRLMCELAHGEPPSSKHVAAHSCNKGHEGCVNPRHMIWKTPRENLLDRRAAGTLPKKRWSTHGSLTPEQVAQICALKGTKNQREIGAMFGISYQHVSVVQQGKLRYLKKVV